MRTITLLSAIAIARAINMDWITEDVVLLYSIALIVGAVMDVVDFIVNTFKK
jgi:hypothetical protein